MPVVESSIKLFSVAGHIIMYGFVSKYKVFVNFFSLPIFMLEELIEHDKWLEFLKIKDNGFLSKSEYNKLNEFVINKEYLQISQQIINNTYTFSTPIKHEISKQANSKKRVIYTYSKLEMNILKFISSKLYKYDYLFANTLYSFRKNKNVKCAIKRIKSIKNINNYYAYKVDISNYFNSININILLKNLANDIDSDVYGLFYGILINTDVIFNGNIINDTNKGVMAGIPIAAFLANYYLKDVDHYFSKDRKILYFRYSDDIIIFSKNKDYLNSCVSTFHSMIANLSLVINHNKEKHYNPGDTFEFLGFSFNGSVIDISDSSIKKIKGKIKRKCRGLRRWAIKNNIPINKAIKYVIYRFNSKFYGINDNELSWKYWFFPFITTSKTLKIVDKYFQDELRYIKTGKHNKMNYKALTYDEIKKLGYKPLTSEYYNYKKLQSTTISNTPIIPNFN